MPPPGSHSLKYRYNITLGEPWYLAESYVDDTQFVSFHSKGETGKYELRAPWVKQEGTEYWGRENENVRTHARIFQEDLKTVRDYYNQSHDGE